MDFKKINDMASNKKRDEILVNFKIDRDKYRKLKQKLDKNDIYIGKFFQALVDLYLKEK